MYQSKIKSEQKYPTIPQHPPVRVRCTHQSMAIKMTLSTELRAPVLNIGTIQVTIWRVPLWETMSITMVPQLN